MVTPLASRFAVLPIDDDGDTSRRITAKSLNKRKDDQSKPSTSTDAKKIEAKKKQNSKKKPDQCVSSKPKLKPKNDSGKKKTSQEQWEQWKQKDAEFVDGRYEDELHQAMLLSKLDFEENKEHYNQIIKATEEEKKVGTKKNKKSNKALPMSLSQFNQLNHEDSNNDPHDASCEEAALVNGKQEVDPEFFDRVKSDAKKAFKLEQVEEERKARQPNIDQLISIAQYQEKLEKSNEEISRLKQENETLQVELSHVKTRNKKLCQLLLQGEMKDKAEVLVEVDKLQRARDELSSEVCSLAAQLEQEKSKVRALSGGDSKAKDKNKKRTESK